MNNLNRKSKHYLATAIAFNRAESEKEFLELRTFYLNMYTLKELQDLYSKI